MHLAPALMRYDWGSAHGIPELLGFAPDGGPWAEAWWGAHPLAPSTTEHGSLSDLIAADPVHMLGAEVTQNFGRLPYLLKVLAIGQPLSIQVHPSLDQASHGFAAEEAAGVDLHDARRTFKDTNHKPEVLVAVTELTVLSGFRAQADLAADLAALGGADAEQLARHLAVAGLAGYVERALEGAHADAITRLMDHGAAAGSSLAVAAHAARVHHGDPGALVALAMNAVTLAPGEALYTPSGIVHCYVSGLGVEIMANSDNVVRAGLTSKPVNAALLRELAVLHSTAPIIPTAIESDGGRLLVTDAADFALTVVRDGAAAAAGGPRIVVAIEGDADVATAGGSITLSRGESAFVAASEGAATVTARGLTIVASVRGSRG